MKLIYLKSALKCDSFDVAFDIKIQFFRVLVTIEPGRSLLQFVTTNCLMTGNIFQEIFVVGISLFLNTFGKNSQIKRTVKLNAK